MARGRWNRESVRSGHAALGDAPPAAQEAAGHPVITTLSVRSEDSVELATRLDEPGQRL